MATTLDRTKSSIPVTVVTAGSLPAADAGAAVLTLAPPPHAHSPGSECPACAAHSDIRAMLFDLLTAARLGLRPSFERVIVDARGVDAQPAVDRLTGRAPAAALRDHVVARSFHLVAG